MLEVGELISVKNRTLSNSTVYGGRISQPFLCEAPLVLREPLPWMSLNPVKILVYITTVFSRGGEGGGNHLTPPI